MAKKLSAYNRYMAKALKGKMTGKTKAQRKAIFRAAAKGWKGGRSVKVTTLKRKGKWTKAGKKSGYYTPRKTKGKVNPVSRKRGFLTTSTFMKFARLFALAAPAAAVAMGPGTPQDKIKEGAKIYTGFDMQSGTFSLANLARGWVPFVATAGITHGISKLIGMIRRL